MRQFIKKIGEVVCTTEYWYGIIVAMIFWIVLSYYEFSMTRKRAAEVGYAQYNQETGEFEWLDRKLNYVVEDFSYSRGVRYKDDETLKGGE